MFVGLVAYMFKVGSEVEHNIHNILLINLLFLYNKKPNQMIVGFVVKIIKLQIVQFEHVSCIYLIIISRKDFSRRFLYFKFLSRVSWENDDHYIEISDGLIMLLFLI